MATHRYRISIFNYTTISLLNIHCRYVILHFVGFDFMLNLIRNTAQNVLNYVHGKLNFIFFAQTVFR